MNNLDSQKLKIALDYIDSWLDLNFHNSRLPGMQLAIRHKGRLVYSKALGYANLDKKQPLTTKQVFRIASHSKTFTATAIMQLKEAGKLNLDDPLSQHLRWFKSSQDARINQVTIRQFLNHTAGIIRDGEDSDFWQVERDFPDAKELKYYATTAKLIYDPDELFKYSNYGFGYLGLLIEAVSGEDYRTYVLKHIIKPLGLGSTGAELDNKAKRLLPTGYGYEILKRPRQALQHINTKALAAATGFYANAEDLTAYFSAHFIGNDVLLSDASKRLMQHGYWKVGRDSDRYGLGMAKYSRKGWNLYGHSGGFPGFITNSKFDSKKQFASSVLTNAFDGQASLINNYLIDIIDTFQKADRPDRKLDRYAGRFAALWGPIDIVVAGKKLYGISPLAWNHFDSHDNYDELSPIDANTLMITKSVAHGSQGEPVTYNFDGANKVTSIVYAGSTMLPWETALKKKLL